MKKTSIVVGALASIGVLGMLITSSAPETPPSVATSTNQQIEETPIPDFSASAGDIATEDIPVDSDPPQEKQKDIQWKGAFGAPYYDTPDGALHVGEYAFVSPIYTAYVATSSEISSTTSKLVVYPARNVFSDKPFDGMTEVHMIGTAYYNIFEVDGVRDEKISTKGENDAIKINATKPTYIP